MENYVQQPPSKMCMRLFYAFAYVTVARVHAYKYLNIWFPEKLDCNVVSHPSVPRNVLYALEVLIVASGFARLKTSPAHAEAWPFWKWAG